MKLKNDETYFKLENKKSEDLSIRQQWLLIAKGLQSKRNYEESWNQNIHIKKSKSTNKNLFKFFIETPKASTKTHDFSSKSFAINKRRDEIAVEN